MLKEVRWLEALAKVRQKEKEAKNKQTNGSRLREHRMPRVPLKSWIFLVMVIVAMFVWWL